jgi:hypothetical protein
MPDTLLAHLVGRLASNQWENIATESLAYLLRTPALAAGFHRHASGFRADLPSIAEFQTQNYAPDDNAIPDLVGVTQDGSPRLIVEVKFDAALTVNQPNTYLERLLVQRGPGLLLFLVPARRVQPVWDEVMRRSSAEEHALSTVPGRTAADIGEVTVAVTSWSDLLHDLDHALTPRPDYEQQAAELEQLRGLCERQDREAFQPFTTSFLGGDTGRYLLDLDALITDAVSAIARDELGTATGFKWSAGQNGWFGRYFRLAGWECLLHVNFTRWGRQRPTPLWLRITDKRAGPELIAALSPLSREQPPRFLNDDGLRQIPFDLPHDQSRDVVFAHIEQQLRRVYELLSSCPPPPAQAPTPQIDAQPV